MADILIEVENLSKLYRLGNIGTGTLSHDLNRWWQRLRGKDDPYLLIDEKGRLAGDNKNMLWSLKDLNFSVEKGEVFGIIGKNGAGKSTLLKILSKITKPTTGTVRLGGRVGSLLEVGTGFHPELTGKENVYLNGAILGMKKWEIKKKYDEIIDFSGVEKFIDTPVKRYSSGMFVRLAFAVAAHLDPEILIVDEVLAVGDYEFQKKCLGKMKDVSSKYGRTILFVSHSFSIIKQLCTRAILLEKGQQKAIGNVKEILSIYQDEVRDAEEGKRGIIIENPSGYFTDWKLDGLNSINSFTCRSGDTCTFSFGFCAQESFKSCEVRFMIRYDDLLIVHGGSLANGGARFTVEPGQYTFKFRVELPVRDAEFDIEAQFYSQEQTIDHWKSSTKLVVLDNYETHLYSGVINPAIQFYMEEKITEVVR